MFKMELKKKKKEIKFKINNLLDSPKYEKLKCKCDNTDIEKQYPILNCLSCKFKENWESVPKESFNHLGKTINEIELVRGKFEDVLGWKF